MGIFSALFSKKKKSQKQQAVQSSGALEKRKSERRGAVSDRRQDVRWEPEKEPRRQGDDQRKDNNVWKERP